MTAWTDDDPGVGDPFQVERFGLTVRALADECAQAALDTRSAGDSLTRDDWAGEAADAWRLSAEEPITDLIGLSTALERVVPALSTYAEAVRSIAYRSVEAQEQHAHATTRMHGALGWESDPYVEAQRQRIHDQATVDQRTASDMLALLAVERQQADDALVAALSPADAGWASQRAILRAAGVTRPDDLTSARLAEAHATIARRLVTSDPVNPDDAAALAAYFSAWGEDRTSMAVFFRDLGGRDTADLVDRIGVAMNEKHLDPLIASAVAQAVRTGLSTGSQQWTQLAARRFADEMLVGTPDSIAYLFADSARAPLGKELTVAMANAFDAFERGATDRPIVTFGMSSPGQALLDLEGGDGDRANDPAGRILSTLGTYPQAALDWLSSTADDPHSTLELGPARITYWFGERDWAVTRDGFEGPGALWAGALQAPGGPTGPPFEEATEKALATLSTQVMTALADNSALLPEGLSERGAEHLGQALGTLLPALVEYPLINELQGADRNREEVLRPVLGMRETWIPNVTDEAVVKIFGAVGTHTAGGEHLAQSLRSFDQAAISAAHEPGFSWEVSPLVRVGAAHGLVEGSTTTESLALAMREDQVVKDLITPVSAGVGAIPVPYAWAGGLVYGQMVNAGTSWVTGVLADNYATATSELASTTTKDVERATALFEDLYAGLEADGVLPPETTSTSAVEQALGTYDLARDATGTGGTTP